jgi:hypothetical protein
MTSCRADATQSPPDYAGGADLILALRMKLRVALRLSLEFLLSLLGQVGVDLAGSAGRRNE